MYVGEREALTDRGQGTGGLCVCECMSAFVCACVFVHGVSIALPGGFERLRGVTEAKG